MSTSSLLMGLLGTGFGAGLLLIAGAWAGVLGRHPDAAAFRTRRGLAGRLRSPATRGSLLRAGGGLGVGIVAWWATGWPVAAVLVAGLVVGVPWLFGAGRAARARIDRIDALASWCRRLRDMVATGQTTLTQAVRESTATAPAPIAVQVTELGQRLRTGEFPVAARRFADEIDDHIGDQIAAALIISYQQGAGVSRVLSGLAASVDAEVAARRDIEAQRAGPRKTARILVWIYLGLLVALSVNGTYLAPYDSAAGQLVMAALTGIVLGSLVWLRRLSLSTPPPRFLIDPKRAHRHGDQHSADPQLRAPAVAGGRR